MSSVAPLAAIGNVGSTLALGTWGDEEGNGEEGGFAAVFRLEDVVALSRVVMVSVDPRRLSVDALPVDALLPLFLWSTAGSTLALALIVMVLLVFCRAGSDALLCVAVCDAGAVGGIFLSCLSFCSFSGSWCFFSFSLSFCFSLASSSFTLSTGLALVLPPTFFPAPTIAFRAAALVAVDTVDVVDRIDDAPDDGARLIAMGLSLVVSTGGTSGRLGVVPPAILLLVDPADVFLVLPAAGFGVTCVGVSLPPWLAFVLLFEATDAEDVRRDRVEFAVRKAVDASDTVDAGRVELAADLKLRVCVDEAMEPRDVGRELPSGETGVVGLCGVRSPPGRLDAVTVLLRTVEATERIEAEDERSEDTEEV